MIDLNTVWKIEQDILDVVDWVCKNNGLKYSLAYGTLLGAVRHKGFIPWDDDIDIIMPRKDYERLLSIWEACAPEEYIIQNKTNSYDFQQSFTKIRKDHTTYIQEEFEKGVSYHTGIFIDIFPGDRVASGKIKTKLQYAACAINLLLTRNHTSGQKGLSGLLEIVLLSLPKGWKDSLRNSTDRFIQKWNNNPDLPYMFRARLEDARLRYPADMFEEMSSILFAGKYYMSVKDTDTVLRIDYDDYMKLPPRNERNLQHHPLVVDFYRNYQELL